MGAGKWAASLCESISEPITKNGKTVEKRGYISGFVVVNDGKVRSYFYTHRTEAPDNARKAMLGVRWESESKRMHTYYENLAPNKLERKRKGKLLYKRNAGTR